MLQCSFSKTIINTDETELKENFDEIEHLNIENIYAGEVLGISIDYKPVIDKIRMISKIFKIPKTYRIYAKYKISNPTVKKACIDINKPFPFTEEELDHAFLIENSLKPVMIAIKTMSSALFRNV